MSHGCVGTWCTTSSTWSRAAASAPLTRGLIAGLCRQERDVPARVARRAWGWARWSWIPSSADASRAAAPRPVFLERRGAVPARLDAAAPSRADAARARLIARYQLSGFIDALVRSASVDTTAAA